MSSFLCNVSNAHSPVPAGASARGVTKVRIECVFESIGGAQCTRGIWAVKKKVTLFWIQRLRRANPGRSIPAMSLSALKFSNTWQPTGHMPDRGCARLLAAMYSIEGFLD